MYNKKPSKTTAIYKFIKTKIPVNHLFTGIFCYLLIIPNRLLLHFFKIHIGYFVVFLSDHPLYCQNHLSDISNFDQ